jgi:hypothetical protein
MYALTHASTFNEWRNVALKIDKITCKEQWKAINESEDYDWKMLAEFIELLNKKRMGGDVRDLVFSLQTVFHRAFCGIEAESLYTMNALVGTKYLVEDFYKQVVEQMWYVCKTDFQHFSLQDKLILFKKARRSMGRTALCLSGGGAFAMYHLGVCKALFEANCLPSVITGTSGGAIIAAMIGVHSDDELKAPGFLSKTVANRYGCRWLPTLQEQVSHFMKCGGKSCLSPSIWTRIFN